MKIDLSLDELQEIEYWGLHMDKNITDNELLWRISDIIMIAKEEEKMLKAERMIDREKGV